MAHHFTLTRKDLERARHHLKRRHHGHDPKAQKHGAMHQLKTAGEIGLAAFATGVLKGRYGKMSVGPVPADLLAFTALHLAAPFSGKFFHDVANVANGVGAGYFHQLGAGMGDKWANKADLQGWMKRKGELLSAITGNKSFAASPEANWVPGIVAGQGMNRRPLSRAELAAMAQRVR